MAVSVALGSRRVSLTLSKGTVDGKEQTASMSISDINLEDWNATVTSLADSNQTDTFVNVVNTFVTNVVACLNYPLSTLKAYDTYVFANE